MGEILEKDRKCYELSSMLLSPQRHEPAGAIRSVLGLEVVGCRVREGLVTAHPPATATGGGGPAKVSKHNEINDYYTF